MLFRSRVRTVSSSVSSEQIVLRSAFSCSLYLTGQVRPRFAPRGTRVIAELNVGVYTPTNGPEQGGRWPCAG